MSNPSPTLRSAPPAPARLTRRAAAPATVLGLALVAGTLRETPAARAAAPFEGKPWLALSYAGPDGQPQPVLPGTEITATFAEGVVAGDAGCNRYTSGYQLAQNVADIMRITPAATTLRLCPEPAGVMEQETAYLTALPTTTRYRIEGDRLELVKADGALVASFRAAAETSPPAPGTAGTGPAAVTGTLTYRERIALPPDATATVVLADVSRADAPAITLAEQTISPAGQVPISFRLEYDPAAIDPRNRYVVRGTISAGGQLLFTTAQAYPVITQGAPSDVEVVLQRV